MIVEVDVQLNAGIVDISVKKIIENKNDKFTSIELAGIQANPCHARVDTGSAYKSLTRYGVAILLTVVH